MVLQGLHYFEMFLPPPDNHHLKGLHPFEKAAVNLASISGCRDRILPDSSARYPRLLGVASAKLNPLIINSVSCKLIIKCYCRS